MGNESKTYFPALTGLRALAAYMVFFNHFPPMPNHYEGWMILAFFHELYTGVSVFFVLSGFLITIRYSDIAMIKRKWLFNYFRNRFARIYPMFFIITVITFIYYSYYPNKDVINHNPLYVFIANLTLMKGFFHQIKNTGISQSWSLTVEECFYAAAPFIFLISSKIKMRYQVAGLYIMGLLLTALFCHVNFYGFFDSLPFMFTATFFGRCFEFYVGVQLALWYKKGDTNKFLKKYNTAAGAGGILAVIIVLVMCRGKYIEQGFDTIGGLLIHNFLLPVAIAFLLWGLIYESTWLSKLLGGKVFSILGKSSYTFYLIHLGFLSDFLFYHVSHHLFIRFIFTIIIAFILYKLIEEPLNKLIKAKF